MLAHLKDLIIGPALPNQDSGLRRLDKVRALAAFSRMLSLPSPTPIKRSFWASWLLAQPGLSTLGPFV